MTETCRTKGCDGEPWNLGGYRADAFPESLHGYCFTCAWWEDRASEDGPGVVVVERGGDRERMSFDAGQPLVSRDRGMLGFGGRRWVVRFHDGRTVETNNLWHNGVVPALFLDRFPVNAVLDQPPAPHSDLARELFG